MELLHARVTCRCSDLHEFGSSERLLCADRVSNTTDITLALGPKDYEVKPGRAGRYFTGPTFGYEWSEVDCEFMDEVAIDIDKEPAILGELQGRPRTLGAGSVFSWLFHQPPQMSPALIIVDVGIIFVANCASC